MLPSGAIGTIVNMSFLVKKWNMNALSNSFYHWEAQG
jgi:hypothetical protein